MWNYIAERAEAVADLQKQIQELTSSRNIEVSKALAEQSQEIDFLKAELTSTKVRLHDALSQSQAEKDALIRHADASRAELLQQLEELRRACLRADETEKQSSVIDYSESPRITASSSEVPGNEHMPEVVAVSHIVDSTASLWQKLELLRKLVNGEKEKWILQETDASGQELDDDSPDGTASEAVRCSHKIRSSWVVLEEQVLPLIEKFCTAVDQDSEPSNREAKINDWHVLENQENSDGDREVTEQEKTLQSVREQLEEEKNEVIRLKEVVSAMRVKEEALHEMEIKCGNLQAELDSVHVQLQSQEELAEEKKQEVINLKEAISKLHVKDETVHEMEMKCSVLQAELESAQRQLQSEEEAARNLSANIQCASEQLKQQTAELSDKDANIQKLNEEIAELREQLNQQLLVLQTECDEKLNTERKLWQSQLDAKADELLAKCTELEQHKSTLEALSGQCSMLTEERDAKTAEIMNSNSQIDSLSSEIIVVKEQLNVKNVELHEAQTCIEHERKLLKDETESEVQVMQSKVTVLEDEISRLRQELESKTVELANKDEVLTLLEHRTVREQEELKAKIAGLEGQLDSDQKSSVEKLDTLMKEVTTKDSAIRELEEAHAAYCKLTDTKLTELSAAVSVNEDDIKSLLEQHKLEVDEKCERFSEEMATLTSAHEEQLAHLNSEISDLTKNKRSLESEVKTLQDKLASESENVEQLEKNITELVLEKEQCERQLEDMRSSLTAETEQMIRLHDEQITALKSALSDKDHSLSLLNAALSQTCREDVQSVDSSSHTVVSSGNDSSKEAEVLDAGSGGAGHDTSDQSLCAQNYDVPMMVHQITSLSAANTVLRDKIGRLEADLLQIRQTSVKHVDETPQHELSLVSQPQSVLCSSG